MLPSSQNTFPAQYLQQCSSHFNFKHYKLLQCLMLNIVCQRQAGMVIFQYFQYTPKLCLEQSDVFFIKNKKKLSFILTYDRHTGIQWLVILCHLVIATTASVWCICRHFYLPHECPSGGGSVGSVCQQEFTCFSGKVDGCPAAGMLSHTGVGSIFP